MKPEFGRKLNHMRMMATYRNYAKKMMWGAALCAMMTDHALALDGEAFVERLGGVLKEGHIAMKHQSVQVDGANIIIEGVEWTLSPDLSSKDETFSIGTLTFNQVEEGDDGSFSIDTFAVNDINVHEKGLTLNISGIGGKNIFFPPSGKIVSPPEKLPYEKFEIKNVSYTVGDKNILTLRDISTDFIDYNPGKPLESRFSIAYISHDTASVPDKTFQESVTEMGYAGLIEGSFDVHSVWDPASGDVSVDKFALDVKNVGTLSLSMNFTGMTQAVIEEIAKLSKQARSKEIDDASINMAMLGLVQQMGVRNLGIRFDDASVTTKILDSLAKRAGTTKEALSAGAVSQLQMMGSSVLKNPEFLTQLVSAVDSFLKNPKSVEITATPPESVAFSLIGGSAMFAPESLIGMLNVEVRANN